MQTNNKPNCKAAEATAATTNNATRQYEVSDTTAAILDCITAVSDMYSHIADVLEMCYGKEYVDSHTAPYLNAVNDITDLLHKELRTRVIDALMDVKTAHAPCVQI